MKPKSHAKSVLRTLSSPLVHSTLLFEFRMGVQSGGMNVLQFSFFDERKKKVSFLYVCALYCAAQTTILLE